jgi:DNA polymerase III epsilon subunit-like protein
MNTNNERRPELFISVDIEADGQIPGTDDFSMLSIGAVDVHNLDATFYLELRPISDRFVPEVLAVSGLDRDWLLREGTDPTVAMTEFAAWVDALCAPTNAVPVFVGFAAPFDWMFTHWYFLHFVGRDPFGFTALDIKAYSLGIAHGSAVGHGSRWSSTSKSELPKNFQFELGHNALADAVEQAKSFRRMLETDNRCGCWRKSWYRD